MGSPAGKRQNRECLFFDRRSHQGLPLTETGFRVICPAIRYPWGEPKTRRFGKYLRLRLRQVTKALELLETMMLGQRCTYVEKVGHLWQLRFGDGDATLNLECPWRLLLNGAIAFGGDDDGQQFGLPTPLDGVKETEKLLSAVYLLPRTSIP
jgi:hypothetical protein